MFNACYLNVFPSPGDLLLPQATLVSTVHVAAPVYAAQSKKYFVWDHSTKPFHLLLAYGTVLLLSVAFLSNVSVTIEGLKRYS